MARRIVRPHPATPTVCVVCVCVSPLLKDPSNFIKSNHGLSWDEMCSSGFERPLIGNSGGELSSLMA